jgi:DNA-directed RNA polymerase specialized sigma subunit
MCQNSNQNLIGLILNSRHSEPMTLQQIAEHEGVSHQYIAEVLQRALRKVRKSLEDKNITLEDLL